LGLSPAGGREVGVKGEEKDTENGMEKGLQKEGEPSEKKNGKRHYSTMRGWRRAGKVKNNGWG